MRIALATTKCRTENGAVYDLGEGEHPPVHSDHVQACPGCLVVNAWTQIVMIDLMAALKDSLATRVPKKLEEGKEARDG